MAMLPKPIIKDLSLSTIRQFRNFNLEAFKLFVLDFTAVATLLLSLVYSTTALFSTALLMNTKMTINPDEISIDMIKQMKIIYH